MKNNVIDKIIDDGIIQRGMTVIVGFSGGPDSLCLLHSLAQIRELYDLNIVAVHVNHKLRAAADTEAMNAANICERLDIECAMFDADCESMARDMKVSTEEAGRNIRYSVFDDVAAELEESGIPRDRICIALAHNADDQSETVLFRLIRGTGVHGLAGMPSFRISEGGYMIVRPLLEIPRADIEEYIRVNKLHPNMDESNEGTDYTRNKIRNELIPYIEKNYNPNIRQLLRRFAEIADCDDSFIQDIALSECDRFLTRDEEKEAVFLDISEIKEYPVPVNTRIITAILTMLDIENKITYDLLLSIHKLIYSENPSARLDLPGGCKAIREYDRITFTADASIIDSMQTPSQSEMELEIDSQILKRGEYDSIISCNASDDNLGAYAAFDFDLFNKAYPGKAGDIVLRSRREGDYIAIAGGSKKIQDFLVDSKVRKNERDNILLVCIGSEVLWILPNEEFANEMHRLKGKFSQNFQINQDTERVLFLEVAEKL